MPVPRPAPAGPRGTSHNHLVADATAVRDESSEPQTSARRTQRVHLGPERGGHLRASLRQIDVRQNLLPARQAEHLQPNADRHRG
jgi:hypothetical protein